MKSPHLVLLVVAVSAATSAGAHVALRASEPAVRAAPVPEPTGASAGDVAALREEVAQLQRALAEQRLDFAARLDALARRPVEPVAAAAPAAPAAPGAGLALVAAPPRPTGEVPLAERSAQEIFDALMAGDLWGPDAEEVWVDLASQRRTKELVDLFEAHLQRNPNDPAAHVAVAGAYIRMIEEVGSSPLAGTWATKADKAYDAALAIDPTHVEARLSKAISLSFWPPIFGKQPQAVKQFEILIGQLDGQPLKPEYAQAWVMLGNLHAQAGKQDEALAVWQKGAALFPHDASLAGKVMGQ